MIDAEKQQQEKAFHRGLFLGLFFGFLVGFTLASAILT